MSSKEEYALQRAALAFAEYEEQYGMYADIDKRITDTHRKLRELVREELRNAALAYALPIVGPNAARELTFARIILTQQIDLTGEVRKLAEDTVNRAKLAKRTR